MSHSKSALPVHSSLLHLIHRVQQCADSMLESKTQELDLTSTQATVLSAVYVNAGTSQAHLCEVTGVDRSTMADVVHRMVKKGYLRRVKSKEDARAYVVTLTGRGHSALQMVAPLAASTEKELLAALPTASRTHFVESLRTILSALKGGATEPFTQEGESKRDRPAISGSQSQRHTA